MKLNILLGDLLSVRCDGWVIPAGGQLSRRIFRHGGDILTVEWEQPGWELQEGGTIITSGGDWPVRYLLHTAFPDSKEDTGDYAHLAKCCRSLLTKANNINSCRKDTMHHLAMPLPTGYSLGHSRYGTTMESLTAVTLLVTVSTYRSHRAHGLEQVTIVCRDEADYTLLRGAADWLFGGNIDPRSRIRGSLLCGAAGDALGYPVEFCDAAHSQIRAYRLDAKTGTAVISDDTQMTLFTACGLLFSETKEDVSAIDGIAWAYEDWLTTQQTWEKRNPAASWIRWMPELNVRRAPGSTCLTALQAGGGSIEKPINSSKGCGGVMRIAPIALRAAQRDFGRSNRIAAQLCGQAAAITHGHPLGWLSGAALGNILYDLMGNFSLDYAVEDTIQLLAGEYAAYPEARTLAQLLNRARELAALAENVRGGDIMQTLQISDRLGEGWVGEEALAVGLFAVLATRDGTLEDCLACAVGHRGDSDSTGSIAGQIWGAYHGSGAIPESWLEKLELRDVITEIADDLTDGCKMRPTLSYRDPVWQRKYYQCRPAGDLPRVKVELLPVPSSFLGCTADNGKQFMITLDGDTICQISYDRLAARSGDVTVGLDELTYDTFFLRTCTADFSEETGLWTCRVGSLRQLESGTVKGNYHDIAFTLVPGAEGKPVEVLCDADPIPWVASILYLRDWEILEIRMRQGVVSLPAELLALIATRELYKQGLFGAVDS